MRYALTIKGRVQNAGYRNLIEKNARARRLRGYVFNDIDGTVKLVCDGAKEKIGFADARDISSYDSEIDEFVDVITLHEEDIFVEDIFKSEVPEIFPIPEAFARLQTDMLEDIGRKLDKGVGAIKSVKEDTILLGDIKADTGILKDIKSNTGVLHEHTDLLHDHTGLLKDMKDGQNKMIKILGKSTEILEKIAEK